MKKTALLIFLILILISKVLWAQNENEILQFNNILNQFNNVRDFCISADGNEAFFTVQSPNGNISQLATIKKENNKWLEPDLLPFCDSFMYLEPFLSKHGNRLFFASNRPLNDSFAEKKDFDIWYVDRGSKKEKWSKPKNIGKTINSDSDEFYPTISDNNNLYFTKNATNGFGKDDIYFCKWEDGKYLAPALLSENINSAGYEFNAFISKKENFILYTKYNAEDGQGSGDLYISKRERDGTWSKSRNIGVPINTKFMEYCPFYDEKNQILYFTSKRQDIKLRNFKSISDFKKYTEESKNGLSKIYMTPFRIQK